MKVWHLLFTPKDIHRLVLKYKYYATPTPIITSINNYIKYTTTIHFVGPACCCVLLIGFMRSAYPRAKNAVYFTAIYTILLPLVVRSNSSR